MAYNNGREDRKWRIWKEAEEKVLREHGVDEATIEQIRIDDRADFNLFGKPLGVPPISIGLYFCPGNMFSNILSRPSLGTSASIDVILPGVAI